MSTKKQKNYLLLKSQLGEVRQSHYQLPQIDFVYGKHSGLNQRLTVKDNLDWKVQQPNDKPTFYKDFKKINKYIVVKGIKSNKQIKAIKNDLSLASRLHRGSKDFIVKVPTDDFRYGQRNKPSTPITHVMQNVYGMIGEQEQKQNQEYYQYQQKLDEDQHKKINSQKMHQRSQSLGIKNSKSIDNLHTFKLPKFQNVKSKFYC